MTMGRQLNLGDGFPDYHVRSTDGETLRIPENLSGEYSVILFYRGHW
jgi:peroxiredoxin